MAEKKTATSKKTTKKSTKKPAAKKSTSKAAAKKSTSAKKTASSKKAASSAKKSTAAKKPTTKAAAAKDDSHATKFMDFLREQGVVALAVAVVLGVAAKTAVDGLVDGVVNPFIGMFIQADNLADASFIVGDTALTNGPTEFQYGLFLSGLLNLLIVAFVVYLAVKVAGLDKLDKKKD